MRRIIVALVSLALVGALGVSARATHTDLADGNDVRGLLDVRTVVLRHDRGPYTWIVRTFSSWTLKAVWDRGFVVVELDTIGSKAIDYRVLLRSDGRSMVGDLFRIRADGVEVHLRSLRARRAGSHGAGVELPRAALRYGSSRTSFFWSTFSLFAGGRCRTTCIDRAPDGDTMVEQGLVEPSPSPTPTATPTPTPTATPSATPTATPTP